MIQRGTRARYESYTHVAAAHAGFASARRISVVAVPADTWLRTCHAARPIYGPRTKTTLNLKTSARIAAAVVAVVALSASTTVATATFVPGLMPKGERGQLGARGPAGPPGRAGLDGKDGKDVAPAATATETVPTEDTEPHLHLMGRDLGPLSEARSYCRSVQLDIPPASELPSYGGSTQYPNANQNRASCGYSNADLDKFLDDREAKGDYDDFVY